MADRWTRWTRWSRSGRSAAVGLALCLLAAACSSGGDGADPTDDGAIPPSTQTTIVSDGPAVVGGDIPADGPGEPSPPPTDETEVDVACANFRTYVVADAPCDRLVEPADDPVCSAPNGGAIECSAVPRVARVAQMSGAVIGGQPITPDVEAIQFGSGPGPTNTSLLLFTEAPLPESTADQLELAVVYEAPGGAGCEASGEAWDGGSFVSVLRLGPGPARVTDLGCRPDGFSEISQRSSWLVAGDIVIVHLPVDLPGAPGRVTGTFRSAPDFAFADGRTLTRRLDPSAWDFAEPIDT